MKKLIIFFLAFIGFLSLSYSTNIYENNINNCMGVEINVEGSYVIDKGEYNLSNCENVNTTFLKCSCNDIELSTLENTINNYTFNIRTNYYVKYSKSSSGKIRWSRLQSEDVVIKFKVDEPTNNSINITSDTDLNKQPILSNNVSSNDSLIVNNSNIEELNIELTEKEEEDESLSLISYGILLIGMVSIILGIFVFARF